MRRIVATLGFAALALAGCSKAPDGADTGPTLDNASTAGLAFTYAYSLKLPARAIDELQEAHAAACEALGPERCRITGITYDVDQSGDVTASLSANVASSLARRFGHDAITSAERAGATLTGAHIGGTETAQEELAAAGQSGDAQADLARMDRELARSDLPAAERAELQAQRSARLSDQRAATAARGGACASIAMAPVNFSYETGRGSGFVNQLRDSGDTALASTIATLGGLIWLVATLGPPLLALLILIVLWIRLGLPLWRRFVPIGDAGDRNPHDPA